MTANSNIPDTEWIKLYTVLEPQSRRQLDSSRPIVWQRQVYDVSQDNLQECVFRLFKRSLKAARGEASPIESLLSLGAVILRNHSTDRKRREGRLIPFPTDEHGAEEMFANMEQVDPADVAVDNVEQEEFFTAVAEAILKFSQKKQSALLTDLANSTRFDAEPTPLQRGFLKAGINLKEYQCVLPADPKLRSQHSANLHLAYQELKELGLGDMPQYDQLCSGRKFCGERSN